MLIFKRLFDSVLPLCTKKRLKMKLFPIKQNAKVRDFYNIVLNVYKTIAKMSLGKECKIFSRQNCRTAKEVLKTSQEFISDKQLNLEELVAEYEKEASERALANKSVHLYEIATWLSTLKNREDFQIRLKSAQEERQNIEIAERYFDKLKRKNIIDAQFLREKSFPEQHPQHAQAEIDYSEIYEETKNMRRVIDTYNLQKTK